MELAHSPREVFTRTRTSRLSLSLAKNRCEVREAQRLRYRVFAKEMGARLDSPEFGLDRDYFDDFCQHLLVRDTGTGEVVGCYRILTDWQAVNAGGFYSETAFELEQILALPGRFMEVGRTCIHPDYRNGATIMLLWSGLARFMTMNGVDHLIGCASIPMSAGGAEALSVFDQLREKYLSPPHLRVVPRLPLPRTDTASRPGAVVPTLLKGYLRLGGEICGEPCLVRAFNVADVFVLLRSANINRRYLRHFTNPSPGRDRVGIL